MPRIPVDYTKTIIYKLVHKEDYDNANIYIGSTTDFTKRKSSHKCSCNNETRIDYNDKKYQYIRDNGGWEEWVMVEIEKYPCNDGNEARAREEYWKYQFNAILNMCKAFRTKEQEKEQKKEWNKKDREINKEIYKQKDKERYKKNKEKILEKITCECGCIISSVYINDHLKTKKHINLINASAFGLLN
jgi:hypothetical protein